MTGTAVAWSARSLTDFGDQPLEDVAGGYDLVVIDHPFCGRAALTGCLRPLDDLLDSALLAELRAQAVGASHDSYDAHGHQWGLASDAACQVSATRPDLLPETPSTWPEVLSLARSRRGQVALPLAPAHAISSWLTLIVNHGAEPFADRGAGRRAAELLVELARLGPREAFEWEPPDALARLTGSDELVYIPLTYGYSSYATAAVARPCRFADIPSAGRGSVGAVLGGAGLAVSAAARDPEAAAAFAAWACSAEAQAELVARTGGQPGNRAAWDDPQLDALAGGFYSDTRATIEGAWLRPRDAWWPAFQLEAGEALTALLAQGVAAEAIAERLETLHLRHAP